MTTMLRRLAAVLATSSILVTGCGAATDDSAPPPGPAVSQSVAAAPPANLDSVREFQSVREQRDTAPPARITIPALGIDAPLSYTGLNPDNTLAVPEFGDISWYDEGATPGNPGPAGILGHVDSRSGPDVFYRLHELRPGDTVTITTTGGEQLVFTITGIEQHAKALFPTEEVWLPTPEPELRLITCGGEFDQGADSYRDNIIAFAELTT
ncbi:class F sortase [Hoyosella sp. G463]|uniref:Class F sortase n=1 Tax=Lolliginicoccus lacisalsi TaxID=2742202 RepID=A0A927PJV3_9ACTN|nr:class F sortase [Lolliginicoccus lacisalsi]MBD8504978.1 class F sortase [Lolliginicoccus lacisalsi]